jgi:predicted dehydrogenase
MKDKIRIGIIGCGHLGKMHLKNLKDIGNEFEDIILEGIFDVNNEVTSLLSKENGVKAFKSLEEMVKEINTAIIVTPTSTHFELAFKTLSNNINTFIEKPVTDKISSGRELVDILKNKNVIVQVGHIERFNPALLSVDTYDINPLFIESHRLAEYNPRGTDVSVIHDLMIHDIDIILNLVRSKVKKIDANGVAIFTNKIDIANARLSFENGCVANITASRISQKKMRKMRIFQSDAYISVDFLKNTSEVFKMNEKGGINLGLSLGEINKDGKIYSLFYNQPKPKQINAMKYELMSFFDCIRKKVQPEVTLKDGVQALEVATEIINEIEKSGIKV